MTISDENGCNYTETCITPWSEMAPMNSEKSQPDGFGADGCTDPEACASAEIEAGDTQSAGSGAQRTTDLNSASRVSPTTITIKCTFSLEQLALNVVQEVHLMTGHSAHEYQYHTCRQHL